MMKYPTFDEFAPYKNDGTRAGWMWGFGGYLSKMIHQAVAVNDDPEGFVHFMREAGCDSQTVTLDNLTMEQYCDKYNAPKCKKALSQLQPKEKQAA